MAYSDHTQAEREAETQPDRVADDPGRETMAGRTALEGRTVHVPDLRGVGEPVSVGDFRDLEAAVSEITMFHAFNANPA